MTDTTSRGSGAYIPVVTTTGDGRPALILHGGGGPFTVASIADHLAATMQTLLPVHPGWNGTPALSPTATIADFAHLYLTYLAEHDLSDVVVIGSSLGGWIAAEMAIGDTAGRIGAVILIDAVGIDVPGHPVRDFFALDARGVAEYSFHDAQKFYRDPALSTPEQLAGQQSNMATMRAVAGDPYMHDPTLAGRLDQVRVPALVVWGDSDRIVTPDYGRAFAGALPDARFVELAHAGHLPQIEQPAALFAAIDGFLTDLTQDPPSA